MKKDTKIILVIFSILVVISLIIILSNQKNKNEILDTDSNSNVNNNTESVNKDIIHIGEDAKKELESLKNDKNVIINEKEIMVFKTQIRAILRAALHGDLSIVFPKVSTLTELREYKEILKQCQNELENENTQYKKHMKVGIIVEIPSVALMAYELAKECDFFFIDTNSLTNYAFGNKKKLEMPNKFQPVIMKLLQQTIEGAHDAGIFCGICGDIIEDELYMPLLIGLGIDQFSMDAKNIENARQVISRLDKYDCKELVEEILELRTLEEIENKLKNFN